MFVRFEGEGGQHCLPYFIALDHEKRAVVLAIRGTLSLQDTVTGAFCTSETPQLACFAWHTACVVHCNLRCIARQLPFYQQEKQRAY